MLSRTFVISETRIGYDFHYSPLEKWYELRGGRRLADLCLRMFAVYSDEIADLSLDPTIERPTLFLASKFGDVRRQGHIDFTVANLHDQTFQIDTRYRSGYVGSDTKIIIGPGDPNEQPYTPSVEGSLIPWVTKYNARNTDEIADVMAGFMDYSPIAIPPHGLRNPENASYETALRYATRLGRITSALLPWNNLYEAR